MKTSLKFLLAFCFCLTLMNLCTAQDAMVQLDETILELELIDAKTTPKEDFLSPKQVYLNHTQFATDQFNHFLATHVYYPESLKEHCVEGDVIVEVLLLKNGTIKEAKIFKSLHQNFDELVLATFQKMGKIDLNDSQYKGARRLRVPVSFKLH